MLGVWRSLVARSVRVGEVPSSNLGTPTASRGNPWFPREPPPRGRAVGRSSAGPAQLLVPSGSDQLAVHDCRALVFDVVESCFRGDLAGFGRDQAELEPQGARSYLDGLTGVRDECVFSPEHVDQVDRVVDVSEPRHTGHAEYLVVVERPDRNAAVALSEQVAHDAVARPGGGRRRPEDGERP